MNTRIERILRNSYNWCRRLQPRSILQARYVARKRSEALSALRRLTKKNASDGPGAVLVDATWYNANYWFRYGLLRTALGQPTKEIGFLGRYRRTESRMCLEGLGIENIKDLQTRDDADFAEDARYWLSKTECPHDILEWNLPHSFPPEFIYDEILSSQQKSQVDINDPGLVNHVAQAFRAIADAESLLDQTSPDLLVLSHAINLELAPMAWIAAQRGIPTIVAFGNFGVLRFWRIYQPGDIVDWWDRLEKHEFKALSQSRIRALEQTGAAQLGQRLEGRTNDLGAAYAFRLWERDLDRTEIAAIFDWSIEKPIVAVYAPNWFDYPHTFGMINFLDFRDWLEVTISAAIENTDVNWLIRAHPCDNWYGGESINSILTCSLPSHIRICPDSWNGRSVIRCADAMVTCHSTGGVEFAAHGKPVLVSDRGWYHSYGFVTHAASRADYAALLRREWWLGTDSNDIARHARVFSGLAFGAPGWQSGFLTADDSEQDKNWERVPELLSVHNSALEKEIETLSAWCRSRNRHYHFFKMLRADSYQTSNTVDIGSEKFMVDDQCAPDPDLPIQR